MRNTYRNANGVLVLDRELQELVAQGTSQMEIAFRMTFVGWARRLWTLQEAALAHRLFLQTKFGPYLVLNPTFPLGCSTFQIDREEILDLPSKICLGYHFQHITRNLLMSPTRDSPFLQPRTKKYKILCMAVMRRSTSKLADEALVLAEMVKQDGIKDIVAVSDVDSRMSILHSFMWYVPDDILFPDVERIGQAPFRWAPRSLRNFTVAWVRQLPSRVFPCNINGLYARYRGFIPNSQSGSQVGAQDGKYYLHDTHTGLTYILRVHGDQSGSRSSSLPDNPAFLFHDTEFKTTDDPDVAVVNILGEGCWGPDPHNATVESRHAGIYYKVTMVATLHLIQESDNEISNGLSVIEGRIVKHSEQTWWLT